MANQDFNQKGKKQKTKTTSYKNKNLTWEKAKADSERVVMSSTKSSKYNFFFLKKLGLGGGEQQQR